ncbi:MAG: hypothetical protein GXO19_04575 [Epsilonproteobacteria bacterium]|nr:hypothetical protein [Campylobacterota bacterium]
MRCDFYVARQGDRSRVESCREYADYLHKTQVYGKAAWYYLLSLQPEKALESAQKAVKMGEGYAYEYMGDAYLILGKREKAEEAYRKFSQSVGNTHFFTSKSFPILERLYTQFPRREAEKILEK